MDDEYFGETPDLIARTLQELSPNASFSFDGILRYTPIADKGKVEEVAQSMIEAGAIVRTKRTWFDIRSRSTRFDPKQHFRVVPEALNRYRESFAPPPAYEIARSGAPPAYSRPPARLPPTDGHGRKPRPMKEPLPPLPPMSLALAAGHIMRDPEPGAAPRDHSPTIASAASLHVPRTGDQQSTEPAPRHQPFSTAAHPHSIAKQRTGPQ